MRRQILLIQLLVLIVIPESIAQNFNIENTKAEYDGQQLSIRYDLMSRKPSDKFFILVEIVKDDGSAVKATSFKGDIGEYICPGKDKSITWVPEDDAVFLNDTVSVEIKGEKYEKSFKRGEVLMSSLILPGLGQTKISGGAPWWLAGVAAYGSLSGGFVFNSKYRDHYDAYLAETDPVERSSLFNQSQSDKQLSRIFFISAGALWVGNLIWVAAIPNEYRKLKLPELSMYSVPAYGSGGGLVTTLSLTYNF